MQLHCSPEELNLLASILLNADPAGLRDRVLARDLRFEFDELDQLREILLANWSNAANELAVCHDPATQQTIEARRSMLESMIEKVGESCAML